MRAPSKTVMRDLILECNGNVSMITRRLGAKSRYVVYRQIHADPELKQTLTDAREALLDEVETELFGQVKSGNTVAMLFWLKTQGKHRGWVERQEWAGPDGGPVQVEMTNLKDATDEELRRNLQALARAAALVAQNGGEDLLGDGVSLEGDDPTE